MTDSAPRQLLISRLLGMWDLPDSQFPKIPFIRPYPIWVAEYFRVPRHPPTISNKLQTGISISAHPDFWKVSGHFSG